MTTKDSTNRRPLTNNHLRFMGWVAFAVAIALAVCGVSSEGVVVAFLGQAAVALGLVQARNVSEDFIAGRPNAGKEPVTDSVDVSQI